MKPLRSILKRIKWTVVLHVTIKMQDQNEELEIKISNKVVSDDASKCLKPNRNQ